MDANDYESLALSERCDSLRDARREAIEDAERGEKLNPYSAPDPRYYAYESEYAANV
jgi:hypothetical protein